MWRSAIKYVIIGILTLVSAVIIMGLIYDNEEFKGEILVNKPVYKSFQIFSDPISIPQWFKELKDIKLIEGDLDKPGSKLEFVLNINQSNHIISQTITSIENNKLYAIDYSGEHVLGHIEIFFKEIDGKTIITVHNRYSGTNLINNVLVHFLSPVIKQQHQQKLVDLKTTMENHSW